MINKREQAKKDRLANIAQNQEGVATATATAAESESESIPDEYEIILQSIRDSPHEGCKPPLRPVASLQDILLEFLVFRWDRISDLGLGDLSGDMREQLCTRLGTRRLLSHETVLSLSSRGSGALSLSECSELSEDTIIKVLEKTCSLDTDPLSVSLSASLAEKEKDREKKGGRRKREREEEDEGPALFLSPLHSLTLRNCGHGFGDRAALTLAHLGDPEKGPGLESLSLTGCYRLSDSSLTALLSRCAGLTSLDLSYNSRLGPTAMRKIASLPHLTCLSLSHCVQLSETDLMCLVKPNQDRETETETEKGCVCMLTSLELDGLPLLTDECMEKILSTHGVCLTHLSLRECISLTDRVAVSLRLHGPALLSLSLSSLSLSSAALLGLFLPSLSVSSSLSSSPSLGQLHTVNLHALSFLTDETFSHLCTHSSHILSHIDISGCTLLTDRSLAVILVHCSLSLSSLNISFLRKLSERVMSYLCDKCVSLTVLEVWGCSQLTDSFFNKLTHYQHLVVRGRGREERKP